MNDVDLEAKLHALDLTLSMLIAAALSQSPGALDRMHQSLIELVNDGAKNASAVRPDMPAEVREQFQVAACASLDRIFGTAKAIR